MHDHIVSLFIRRFSAYLALIMIALQRFFSLRSPVFTTIFIKPATPKITVSARVFSRFARMYGLAFNRTKFFAVNLTGITIKLLPAHRACFIYSLLFCCIRPPGSPCVLAFHRTKNARAFFPGWIIIKFFSAIPAYVFLFHTKFTHQHYNHSMLGRQQQTVSPNLPDYCPRIPTRRGQKSTSPSRRHQRLPKPPAHPKSSCPGSDSPYPLPEKQASSLCPCRRRPPAQPSAWPA